MRILSILARHGREKYAGALADLRAFQATRLASARCDLLVVDNAPGPLAIEPGDPETIPASDADREFSAWQAGLAHVGAAGLLRYDLVHLVTSAFRVLHSRYVDRCDARALRRIVGARVAVGHVDYYDDPVELLGARSQHWLRSSFLFLPPAELLALGPLAGIRDGAPFFSGDPARPFRPGAPLSVRYQRYLVDWLTGPGTGQGTEWHSRFALTEATLPFFEAKALAIMNEHLLAIRLRERGNTLVDATWLATWVARHAWWPRRPAIPDWTEQLARRDQDAVVVAAGARQAGAGVTQPRPPAPAPASAGAPARSGRTA
ncbi:MAG TPA: hypothetical protein VEB43_03420 [Anaeromyxobacter sp.]|nr:hypothetical protein [Anaeromyxobacter sp.]